MSGKVHKGKSRVLIVGPYPPPYGGLSVQIARLQALLESSHEYTCEVFNIGEQRREKLDGAISVEGHIGFLKAIFLSAARGQIIHLVTSGHNVKSWLSALTCMLAGRLNGGRTLLVLGSGNLPEYISRAGLALTIAIKLSVRLAGRIVCRNEASREALESAGADGSRILIIPGYLGVTPSEVKAPPPAIEDFMNGGAPVIATHATLDPEYALPLLMELLARLAKKHPRVRLVLIGISAAEASKSPGYEELKERIYFTGYLEHPKTLSVIKRADLFLRATYFDGDSNSVREALALGVPVVASATDLRPDGVNLFRVGDIEHLEEVTEAVLAKASGATPAPESDSGDADENYRQILKLYESLL